MKKIIYSLFAVAMIISIGSCKKTGDVNVFSNVSNFGTGAYLLLDSTLNVNFNSTALATSTVGITVSQAPAGQAIQSIVLFVATSSGYDTTQWHRVKSIPFTGASTKVTATGQDLATALKVPLSSFAPGTNYTFYTRVITKSGAYYDASNTSTFDGTGLVTGSTYNTAFSFTAYITCPFIAPVEGSYLVVEDTWNDWISGTSMVTVTDGPGANQINLSQVYPGPPDGGVSTGKFIVNIDPATGTAYVPKEDIGYYSSPPDFFATGSGGAVDPKLGTACGYVFSCTGYIGLKLDLATASTDYGVYTLILQKSANNSDTGLGTNNVKVARRKF